MTLDNLTVAVLYHWWVSMCLLWRSLRTDYFWCAAWLHPQRCRLRCNFFFFCLTFSTALCSRVSLCISPTVHVSGLCDDVPEATLPKASPGDSWSLLSLQVTPVTPLYTLGSTPCRSFNNLFSLSCMKAGCSMTFSTHTARKAHEKTHTGESLICV